MDNTLFDKREPRRRTEHGRVLARSQTTEPRSTHELTTEKIFFCCSESAFHRNSALISQPSLHILSCSWSSMLLDFRHTSHCQSYVNIRVLGLADTANVGTVAGLSHVDRITAIKSSSESILLPTTAKRRWETSCSDSCANRNCGRTCLDPRV